MHNPAMPPARNRVTGRRLVTSAAALSLVAVGGVALATTEAQAATTTTSANGCVFKPSAATTGAKGTRSASSATNVAAGRTLANVNVQKLVITNPNVTVRNVAVNGSIVVRANGVTLDHVTSKSIAVSSASNVRVQFANVGFTGGDGINVTSDRGVMSRNITFAYNYVHDPRVSNTAHYDGTQVRGVNGMTIACSVYNPGAYKPQFNAGIYLEDANGGTSNVRVTNNWVYGFGFSIMMDAANTSLLSNRVGGDIHWGTCYKGKRVGTRGLVSTANAWDANSRSLALCR